MQWNSSRVIKTLKDDGTKGLCSICQQIWKTQQQPQDWKKLILISLPKKSNTKECANHWTIAFISLASKVMLKILHARLQHYVNQELSDVQDGFRKGRGTRDQIAWWIIKIGNSQKKHLPLFHRLHWSLCVDRNKLWKALKEMRRPDYLTCLLRNL